MGAGNLDKPGPAVKALLVRPGAGPWLSKRSGCCYIARTGLPSPRVPQAMNHLFPNLSSNVLLSMPGFRLYALCAIVLVIKMHVVGTYTAVVRSRLKLQLNPEDAALSGAQLVEVDHPEVARVQRAHRNDLENIPVFLILGFIAVLVGAPVLGLQLSFIIFTAARVAHSITYLTSLQPWRSMSFGVGQLASLALMVMILIKLVS